MICTGIIVCTEKMVCTGKWYAPEKWYVPENGMYRKNQPPPEQDRSWPKAVIIQSDEKAVRQLLI